MGFRDRPKMNPLQGLAKIGVVASWVLLFVLSAAVAILPFGFSADSPALWSVGGVMGMILLSQICLWICPPKVRYFDEQGPEA